MDVTATSPLAIALTSLRQMLRECATWQEAVANLPITQAEGDNIHLRAVDANQARPLAVIRPGRETGYTLAAGGGGNYLRPSGTLEIYVAIDVPPEYERDAVNLDIYAANFFGALVQELADQSAVDDKLAIIRIGLDGWEETAEDDWPTLGRWVAGLISVQWGDG